MNPNLHRVIGIDLGTTYCVVSAYDTFQRCAVVLQDPATPDEPTVPSVVGLHPQVKKVWVGWPAKRNLPNDPRNTVIEAKREMGELFRPDTLARYGGIGQVGQPVRLSFAGGMFLPQEVSAFTLMMMKEIAEAAIGDEVRDAVITVPAYFKAIQRQATEEAALMAGLYPRLLLAEPTAAAICYGVDQQENERKRYLVYDLGGGTFDVSIIEVEGQAINVIATSGNSRLGGGDFDDQITLWALEELKKQYQLDLGSNPQARARVKFLAESAKKRLSSTASDTLNLQELDPQKAPTLVLTREVFLQRIEPLLKKSIDYVNEALLQAEAKGVRRADIDAILLVGGSSKIPKVKELLLRYFDRDESFVLSELDADLVVARGAALMAKQFAPTPPPFDVMTFLDTRKKSQALKMNTGDDDKIEVELITEHSLGLAVHDDRAGERIDHIVKRGTNIPTKVNKAGYTNGGMTDYIPVRVFQGESEKVQENTLIGTVQIGPMEPKPAGEHQFEVEYNLDRNGMLTVTINHVNEGRKYQGQIQTQTAVGGNQLANRAEVLKQMYGGRTLPGLAASTPTPAAATPTTPAPVPPPDLAPEPAAPPAAVETPAAPAVPTPAPASSAAGLPQATVAVPEQFSRIVRRAERYLLTKTDPKLREAYVDFIEALNGGASAGKLEVFAEDLEDAFKAAP